MTAMCGARPPSRFPASCPAWGWRAREFYEGEVARALVRDLRAKGSVISEADLAGYHARIVDAHAVPYRTGTINIAPGLTGGPTLAQALSILESKLTPAPGAPGAES